LRHEAIIPSEQGLASAQEQELREMPLKFDQRRLQSAGIAGAFTLIEVLVVVAIIALLAAILIPSLARAREQAKRVACGSNVHSQLLALFTYAHDNRGFLPVNATQLGNSGGLYVDTLVANKIDPATAKPIYDFRMLMKRVIGKQYDIFVCPSNGGPSFFDPEVQAYVSAGNFLGGQYLNFFNSTCVYQGTSLDVPWAPKPEWKRGGDPATVAIVQDAYWANGNGNLNNPGTIFRFNHSEGLSRSELGYGRFYSFKSSSNRSACAGVNVGYLDGHASWVKNLKTSDPARPWLLDLPWSGSAMEYGGSMTQSGAPITVKGFLRGS
jgi:prepilin-type N-terminal cleavage/methylation domain-containing protein/prepilin-type processing-associated H-X9-DG protein